MHTIKVLIVDVTARAEELTPATLATFIAERLDRMPGFRRRPVSSRHHISHPVWVETHFDPADHIRWCTLEPPGDRRALAELVGRIAGTPLSRERPLWELTAVDGLDGGQLAFVVKLHHALADGLAAAAMLDNVFQADADLAIVQPARPEPPPSPRHLSQLAWRNRLHRVSRLPALAGHNIGALRSARAVRRQQEVRPPSLFSAPRSALNRSLTPERTFAVTDLPMSTILTVRSNHGVTVNDVFLAVCGAALRRHLGADSPAGRKGLVAGVPIGVHTDAIRLSGNRLDHMLVALCTDIDDPVARLHAIARSSSASRSTREALGQELFERRADHTPPGLYPLVIRLWAATHLADRLRPPLSLIASNVAGPRQPLELEGGVVTELWSVGPILEGIGLNLTAWSYNGVLRVSALGCPRTLPDPWVLLDHFDEALAELAAAPLEDPVSVSHD
jgi:WS/DGAT/MGAT family acyltransferase